MFADEDRCQIYNSTAFVTALRVVLLAKNSDDQGNTFLYKQI